MTPLQGVHTLCTFKVIILKLLLLKLLRYYEVKVLIIKYKVLIILYI